MSSTQDLERRAPAEALVTLDARDQWTQKQIALISRTVAVGASAEELHFFLNVAARYNLDPFQGEIYCAKTRGENGGQGRMVIMVGEQGRLKIANRYPDYRGFRSDTVCENDRFMRLAEPKEVAGATECWTWVEHSYSMAASAKDNDGRGKVIGAWCEVYREGRPAVFFFAPLEEYLPKNPSDAARKFIPWFSTESRMIVKCAISTAFRMAFNLAGIYGEEEIEHIRAQSQSNEGVAVEDEIAWGEDEQTQMRMQSLFAAANNCKPGAYPSAKIRLMLAGLTDEERGVVAAEVVQFIRQNGGTVPEPGEIVVDDKDVSFEEPDEQVQHEPDEEAEAVPVDREKADPESLPGI